MSAVDTNWQHTRTFGFMTGTLQSPLSVSLVIRSLECGNFARTHYGDKNYFLDAVQVASL